MKEVNLNCPKCNNRCVMEIERLGGIVGYDEIYLCLDCDTKYAVMYMNDKPVCKKII